MIHMQTYKKKSFHLITVFTHYLSQRCLWKRRGEAQLIGNIWVIVGSTPTSSNAGRDLTVPSEVTALTSASAQACSCQGALGLEKKDRAGRSRRWMVPRLLMGALLTANVWVVLKCNQLVDALGSKKTPYCFVFFGFLEVGGGLLDVRGVEPCCNMLFQGHAAWSF